MASGLEQELTALSHRVNKASEEITRLRKALDESRRREQDLERQVGEIRKQLEASRSDEQFLRMSHRLASLPDALVETRRMIANLIRNIDRAIAELKE